VRGFNEVLAVDAAAGWVDSEGMITYEDLTRECLAHGVMPAVVPQLKTITLGGAVAGVGIESSSHRYGLVHDTMLELEVLLGEGRIVTCTADNEHADLFFGFPNSYGTLGYALRVKARTVPVKPYVRLEHIGFQSADKFFHALGERLRSGEADFVDGTVFSPRQMYITLGRFADTAPYTSDYTYERIYYRSIAEKREDYLTVHDYIWRWDTDWFWCSKNVFAQHPLIRRLYGKERLGSRTYTKIMRWNSRVGITKKVERVLGIHSESVIQDVDIPLSRGRVPGVLWARDRTLAAVGLPDRAATPQVFPLSGAARVVRQLRLLGREAHARGPSGGALQPPDRAQGRRARWHQVALLGQLLHAGGIQQSYGGPAYAALKAKYDPQGAFPQLYEKCVLRR